MSTVVEDNVKVCPVCGERYLYVTGPPDTSVVGDMHGLPIEQKLFPWLCAYSVGEEVYVVTHEQD